MPGVIGQPFGGGPAFRFEFRSLEEIPIVFGVMKGERFAIATLTELLERVSAGRIEKPIRWHLAADVGSYQGLCRKISDCHKHIGGCQSIADADHTGYVRRKIAREDGGAA